ncbi:hypothetical protein EN799_67160, partial [bacterium M00.F.Ca.ET.156.01.1.1]
RRSSDLGHLPVVCREPAKKIFFRLGFESRYPLFLCLSQETSRRVSARRQDSLRPKELGWLVPCDKPGMRNITNKDTVMRFPFSLPRKRPADGNAMPENRKMAGGFMAVA